MIHQIKSCVLGCHPEHFATPGPNIKHMLRTVRCRTLCTWNIERIP